LPIQDYSCNCNIHERGSSHESLLPVDCKLAPPSRRRFAVNIGLEWILREHCESSSWGGSNILNDGIRPLLACLDQNIQQLSTSFSLQRAHGDSRVLCVEEMLPGIGHSATTSLLGSWCSARSESSDSGEEHWLKCGSLEDNLHRASSKPEDW